MRKCDAAIVNAACFRIPDIDIRSLFIGIGVLGVQVVKHSCDRISSLKNKRLELVYVLVEIKVDTVAIQIYDKITGILGM